MYVCRALSFPRVGCAFAIILSLAFLVGCPLPPSDDGPGDSTGADSNQGAADDGDQGSRNPPGGSGANGGTDDDGSGGQPNGDSDSDGSTDDDDGGDDDGGSDGDDGSEAVAPRIGEIPNDSILAGEPYTSLAPALLEGTPPISWSLEVGPLEMTISGSTGIVSWPDPVEGEHAIVIAASGPGGADTEGWTLTVEAPEAQVIVERLTEPVVGLPWANDESESASVSGDGRFVAFSSQASNLVMGDAGIDRDVFVRDRQTAQTIRVTLGHDGAEADGPSLNPVISANGQYVAFQSSAANLVPDDLNDASDVFVWDRLAGTVTRVSVHSSGDEGNLGSEHAAISADGRYVAFQSVAGNLVDDDTNNRGDVFVHDRETGETRRVSVSSNGDEALGDGPNPFLSFDPAISADGRYVAFASYAFNLVADDTNDVADIFLHDTATGATLRISHGADGFETDGDSRSPHVAGPAAQFIVFESEATTICACDVNGVPDVYLFDRVSGATVAISVRADGEAGNDSSGAPMLSEDGRYVVFESFADDLVDDDDNGVADVFMHDTWLATTMIRSVDREGVQGNDDSIRPSLTPDGAFVVFESKATNLTDDLDLGHFSDVFIRSLAD